jgi:hypothetical protein
MLDGSVWRGTLNMSHFGGQMAGSRVWAVFATLVLFLDASASAAPFVYTSQTRSVSATARVAGFGPSQSFSTTGTALFDRTAYVEHTGQFGGVDGWAQQSQTSQLLPTSITTSGAFGGQNPPGTGTGDATGHTITNIAFSVAAATDVRLDAVAGIFTDGIHLPLGARSIKLTGPSANISWSAYFDGFHFDWPGSRSQDLTLQPGAYNFLVDFESVRGGFQVGSNGVSSYNISLTQVPEPASLALLVPLVLMPRILRRRR